jgi:hypothetical protein
MFGTALSMLLFVQSCIIQRNKSAFFFIFLFLRRLHSHTPCESFDHHPSARDCSGILLTPKAAKDTSGKPGPRSAAGAEGMRPSPNGDAYNPFLAAQARCARIRSSGGTLYFLGIAIRLVRRPGGLSCKLRRDIWIR